VARHAVAVQTAILDQTRLGTEAALRSLVRRAAALRSRQRAVARSIAIGGVRLAYTVAGSGAPAVLIHGLGGSGRWWGPVVPALARDHNVHTIDLVGFGASAGQRFSLEAAADQIGAFMDALGITGALVVGHSMGGFIAAELAADRPELVDRLVLVDAAGLPFRARFVTHAMNALRATLESSPRFLAMAAVDTLRAGPFTLIAATRSILASDLSEKLGRIAAPTLVLWGADDPLIPAATGRDLARALRDGRFELVDGAGHSPMWERPERFTALVRAFVRGPRRIPDTGSTAPLAA
jgi:pimeloyl-ACP methyl ester carboxylesterase